MSKNAVLGTNLVDKLVPTADALRESLHDAFGVRQYRVYTVLRTWSGGSTGEGDPSDQEVELIPKPKVEMLPYQGVSGLRLTQEECGIDEVGIIRLREVSLQYAEEELAGPVLQAGQEFFYKITDGQGQLIRDRYWVIYKTPVPDRNLDLGWTIELRLAN